jgi:hypothetical protein
VWSPTCSANPTSGTVSALSVGETVPSVFSFHSTCDGTADITASACLTAIGDEVTLDFLK